VHDAALHRRGAALVDVSEPLQHLELRVEGTLIEGDGLLGPAVEEEVGGGCLDRHDGSFRWKNGSPGSLNRMDGGTGPESSVLLSISRRLDDPEAGPPPCLTAARH
jgi:hypothetical protein